MKKMFKIETTRWIEGYEHEYFNVEAESEEEAKRLIKSGEADSHDGYVNGVNSDEFEFQSIEEVK